MNISTCAGRKYAARCIRSVGETHRGFRGRIRHTEGNHCQDLRRELLRKIPVQPVDRISSIAQITVQGTEVVVGTTVELPKSERTPPVSGSVGAL